jgi:alpha-galactosidase
MAARIRVSLVLVLIGMIGNLQAAGLPAPLTPKPGPEPRINGPTIFGVRPGSPFLYNIPATGLRPMTFSVEGLPQGLELDAVTGQITGQLPAAGTYQVTLGAKNEKGSAQKKFRIVVGDEIALTPPMGWNSYNCWEDNLDQEKTLRAAKAMVASGLSQHGWTYINIDDVWQGDRSGPDRALMANEQRFPDMKGLVDQIHAMGLKAGIYSTPWVTAYSGLRGGTADDELGTWKAGPVRVAVRRIGKVSFAKADARQFAAWGFDYLKYDWRPNRGPETKEMSDALRATGRDLVFSLSNSAPIEYADEYTPSSNAWRITGDIAENWKSMSNNGFNQTRWEKYARPGHWNDPDMLIVGWVGWGKPLHPTRLTPDEQYTHVSLWCLLSAPLLLGCDLEKLDDFTLGLLTNDEVLEVNQDALGKQASRVAGDDKSTVNVYAKPLEDGTWAVGLFNRGETLVEAKVAWSDLKLNGSQAVRDLWRQKDLGDFADAYAANLPPHGVMLVKIGKPVVP